MSSISTSSSASTSKSQKFSGGKIHSFVNSQSVELKVLTFYEALPANTESDLMLWKQRAHYYIVDLEWLIADISHERFWSQMVYNPNCIKCILSFLQNAIPVYLSSKLDEYDDSIKEIYNQIKTLVFTVIRKLTSIELSEDEFMSPEQLAELIYNNNLITLSTLLDICALYSYKYPEYISTMLETLYSIQPMYTMELETFLEEMLENSFDFLEDMFGSKPELVLSDDETEAIPLGASHSRSKMTVSALTDYVLFLLDTSFTLSTFIDKYSPAASIFHKNCLEDRIANFYENTVLSMDSFVREVISCRQMPVQQQNVQNSLKLARYYLLNLYRSCLSSCISNILNASTLRRDEFKNCVDGFLNTLSDGITHEIFIADYHTLFPLHNDLDILQQVAPHLIDSTKIDYILEVVTMYCNSKMKNSNEVGANVDLCDTDSDDFRPRVSKNKHLSESDIRSLISQIKEMLPTLGEGFIQNCLEYYKNDMEITLNSILQESLPPELAQLDRDLPYIPPEPVQIFQKKPNRNNVYDDVIMDIKSVHIGKREENHNDIKSLLNDKSHRREMREFYSKIGTEEFREIGEGLYDDEYDDSYDGPQDLVTIEVIPEDPALKRRDFVVPRALRPPDERGQYVESDSEEDDEYALSSRSKPLDFCQNPEEMRARAEQRWQSRQRGRGGGGSSSGGGGSKPPPARDVKGNVKGQGQSKEVLINRDRKNQNKSSRGNHNRRNMAGRKRAQGMIPS